MSILVFYSFEAAQIALNRIDMNRGNPRNWENGNPIDITEPFEYTWDIIKKAENADLWYIHKPDVENDMVGVECAEVLDVVPAAWLPEDE